MEKLALLIDEKVAYSAWSSVRVSRNNVAISYLLFADNCLLFVKAKSSQVRLLNSVLSLFCKASGLKVNLEKSKAMCSANVPRQKCQCYTGILSITFTYDLDKYLGFLLKRARLRMITSSILWRNCRLAWLVGRVVC